MDRLIRATVLALAIMIASWGTLSAVSAVTTADDAYAIPDVVIRDDEAQVFTPFADDDGDDDDPGWDVSHTRSHTRASVSGSADHSRDVTSMDWSRSRDLSHDTTGDWTDDRHSKDTTTAD